MAGYPARPTPDDAAAAIAQGKAGGAFAQAQLTTQWRKAVLQQALTDPDVPGRLAAVISVLQSLTVIDPDA